MEDSFGAHARRLSGLATRLIGWPPDIFWNATPAELAAILDPHAADADRPLSRTDLYKMLERENDR